MPPTVATFPECRGSLQLNRCIIKSLLQFLFGKHSLFLFYWSVGLFLTNLCIGQISPLFVVWLQMVLLVFLSFELPDGIIFPCRFFNLFFTVKFINLFLRLLDSES